MIRTLRLHGHLLAAFAIGIAVAAVLPHAEPTLRAVVGWNVAAGLFIALSLGRLVRARAADDIRRRAVALDEGGRWILPLSILAAMAGMGSVALEGAGSDRPSAGLVALTVLTVALSWTFVQLLFAFHYAHEFYAADDAGRDREGLLFPGETAPDYWDFLHFAIVIGVAAQTADIQIATRPQRRAATLHSLTAFVFNTVIVAMAVNIAVDLL
jgi:uncharacterized membrane protein